jgi:hypothetical protein
MLLDFINLRAQSKEKFLIMQFSQVSHYFLISRSKYAPPIPPGEQMRAVVTETLIRRSGMS